MATVNRYSQIQQPLLIDPLSVEELSLVPMAKARADAAGVGALASINTDYNVDAKDLNTVSGLVKGIDSEKDRLIDQISSQGVTNETISDVLKLRKSREQIYKTVVQKAEENKAKIERWNDVVDQMAVKYGTDYADAVRSKGYDNWQGTMQGTTPTDFKEEYGPKYIDVESDILQTFKAAGIKSMSGASKVKIEKDPFTGKIKVTDPTRTVKRTNIEGLQAAIDMLQAEYANPETERGKFAKFTGLSQSALLDKLKEYKDISLLEDVRTTGGGTRLYKDDSSNNVSQNIKTEPAGAVEIELKTKAVSPTNRVLGGVGVGAMAWGLEYFGGKTQAMKRLVKGEATMEDGIKLALGLIDPAGMMSIQGLSAIRETGKSLAEYNKVDVEREKKKMLSEWSMSGMIKYMIDKDIISQETFNKIELGDKKAFDEVYEKAYDYMDDMRTFNSTESMYTSLSKKTTDSQKIKGQDVKGSGYDIGVSIAGGTKVYSFDGREVSSEADSKDLSQKLIAGEAMEIGKIPFGSHLTKTSTSDYIPELHGASVVVDPETKIKYLIPNLPTQASEGKYNLGQELENYVAGLGTGEMLPVTVLPTQGPSNPGFKNTKELQGYIVGDYLKEEDKGTRGGYLVKVGGKTYKLGENLGFLRVPKTR